MRIHDGKTKRGQRTAWATGALTAGIAVAMGCMLGDAVQAGTSYCTQTADTLLDACKAGVNEDSLVQKAVCLNISNAHDRKACYDDQAEGETEGRQLCSDQHDWRLDACKLLGEDRYDPTFAPSHFEDDFKHLGITNAYFPLTIGNKWTYSGGGELNTVEVLDRTKDIEGVTCVVFLDQVFSNGELGESTNDWYAQGRDGNVWYCGEETADFESFDGDVPKLPELVSIEGTFKAGRDGAKPGIIFLASPSQGAVYLEEFSLANAEDVTQILSTTYSYGHDAVLDQLVPKQLADRFCNGDCIVAKNFSLLEPGIFARKYYARGIGVFLEVETDTQTVSQLVSCNFDSKCVGLPTP